MYLAELFVCRLMQAEPRGLSEAHQIDLDNLPGSILPLRGHEG